MFISFGYFTKKSLFLLILPIVMTIRRYLCTFKILTSKNMFYPCFLKFLYCLMNGIIWLVVEIKSISNKKEVIKIHYY